MNIHTQEVAAFRFEVGASVDHVDGSMEGFVVDRGHTQDGRESYWVSLTYDDDGILLYAVRGDFPVPFEGGCEIHEMRRAEFQRAA